AVGVSVVTVVPGHAGPSVVLGRRRDDLATDPGLWHVAPSGMLEPPDPSGRGPGPLLSTVRRELAEELGVDAGPLRISVLGIVHDLLRLRPEVCLRLDLAEEDLPERLAAEEFGETALVELSPTGLERLWASLPPPALTPAAAGALALVEAREGWRGA
ncbi:MAG: NUDIX domain-containing protein, partial [Acidimicrobiales bacterium]